MIKKLSASILFLALIAGVFAPAAVQAQDTIGLYFDNAGTLQRFGNVTVGISFDIVAVAKKVNSSTAGEFIMTDIKNELPTVFKLNTAKVNNTNLDLGDNNLGEYLLAYGSCIGAGQVELVRVTYLDVAAAVPADYVLSLRGFGPGDTRPTSFGGEPGYVDCVSIKHVLSLEPWTDFGTHDPTKAPGVESADGVAVLNADLIPNEGSTMGSLKARF